MVGFTKVFNIRKIVYVQNMLTINYPITMRNEDRSYLLSITFPNLFRNIPKKKTN